MPAASLGRFAWQEREGNIGRGIFRLNISDVLPSVLSFLPSTNSHARRLLGGCLPWEWRDSDGTRRGGTNLSHNLDQFCFSSWNKKNQTVSNMTAYEH